MTLKSYKHLLKGGVIKFIHLNYALAKRQEGSARIVMGKAIIKLDGETVYEFKARRVETAADLLMNEIKKYNLLTMETS